ncbi:MAG: hypothetical protein CSB46_05355 [Micrococcales bacterium]|nr:MAG: hypothetical protein CSB46_05355 [Micrococcales bacterium]
MDVVVELGNRSLTVLGDQGQLERGLLNLVSNAVKFTPASGTVTIRAEEVDPPVERPAVRRHLGDEPPGKLHQGGWLQLSVTDTGIGIPAADLDRLFDRFFRASNAVENEIPGTGLGLAIARGIVEHHGGRLEVASELGRGTSMSLLLPLVADPSDCPAGRSPAPAEHVPAPRGAAGDGAEPALPGRSSASSSIEASSAIEVRTPDGM